MEHVWESFFANREMTAKFVDIVFSGTMDKANVTGQDVCILHDGTSKTWDEIRASIKTCYVDFCHGPNKDQVHVCIRLDIVMYIFLGNV